MFPARLFQLLVKLGQTLTDNIGITAYIYKIGVPIPPWDDMDMKMVGQACTGASAEIHADIEAMRFYHQRQELLGLSNEFGQLQHFFVACGIKVRDMPGWCYQQMSVVVGKVIQYYDAVTRSP